jgi:hypothetical protein
MCLAYYPHDTCPTCTQPWRPERAQSVALQRLLRAEDADEKQEKKVVAIVNSERALSTVFRCIKLRQVDVLNIDHLYLHSPIVIDRFMTALDIRRITNAHPDKLIVCNMKTTCIISQSVQNIDGGMATMDHHIGDISGDARGICVLTRIHVTSRQPFAGVVTLRYGKEVRWFGIDSRRIVKPAKIIREWTFCNQMVDICYDVAWCSSYSSLPSLRIRSKGMIPRDMFIVSTEFKVYARKKGYEYTYVNGGITDDHVSSSFSQLYNDAPTHGRAFMVLGTTALIARLKIAEDVLVLHDDDLDG